jgi:DNA-binding response OmpR family regulator
MKKALLIENDDRLSAALTMFLELEDFQVICTEDIMTVLEKVAEVQPGLIFYDLDMSFSEGYGILGNLRSRTATANTPLIFLGTNIPADSRQNAMKLGANECINKPFSFPRLSRAIVLARSQGFAPIG